MKFRTRRHAVNLGIIAAILITASVSLAAGNAGPGLTNLDGIWLFDSANIKDNSSLSSLWDSKVTIRDGSFSLSHFCGLSRDVKGELTLGTAGDQRGINLKIDKIDLSEIWDAVKYPACNLPGIYEIAGDHLTICFQTGPQAARPKEFQSKDRSTVVLELVRASAGFEDFPKTVKVSVTDPDGKAVAGASVIEFMTYWHLAKKNQTPQWTFQEIGKTAADGTARISYDDLAGAPAMARDAGRKLAGLTPVSPASLQGGAVTIQLQPECQLTGTFTCDRLSKIGKPIGWTNVYLSKGGERFGMCDSLTGSFEFPVAPGTYTLNAYGDSVTWRNLEITVPPGKGQFQLPPIEMPVSRRVTLEGQTAPELDGVIGWKGGPVKLADLRGKLVLLDFWGYWCGPCVHAMPVLMDLNDKFKDKGLAIIGVHVDMGGEVDTPAKLDEKIASIKNDLWKGRDLPFPVALISGASAVPDYRSSASAQYGIEGYPTTILIDRAGKVVGIFETVDKPTAVSKMEELLGEKN